jgi:hypothetical protein
LPFKFNLQRYSTVDGGAYINMDKRAGTDEGGGEAKRSMVGAHQYSYSKGVFLGAGLEVSYFSTRDDDTRDFYGINGEEIPEGQLATAKTILYGDAVAGGLHSLHSRGGSLDWCRYVDRPYRLSSKLFRVLSTAK